MTNNEKWTWEEYAEARARAYVCNDKVPSLGKFISISEWLQADLEDLQCMRDQLVAQQWGLA